MGEKIQLIKQEIMSILPQIPFIIDQVDEAIKWICEEKEEGEAIKILNVALNVAKFALEISDRNFYKTQLLLASLLSNIEDCTSNERFKIFETASGATKDMINAVTLNKEDAEARGCFNALLVHLVRAARENEEALVIMLYNILSDLKDITAGMKVAGVKSPITSADYVTILGYAYIMANLRMAGLSLLDKTRSVINEIEIILNNDVIY